MNPKMIDAHTLRKQLEHAEGKDAAFALRAILIALEPPCEPESKCELPPNCLHCWGDCRDEPCICPKDKPESKECEKWKAQVSPLCHHNAAGTTKNPEICAEVDCKCLCHKPKSQPETLEDRVNQIRVMMRHVDGAGITMEKAECLLNYIDQLESQPDRVEEIREMMKKWKYDEHPWSMCPHLDVQAIYKHYETLLNYIDQLESK